MTKSVMIAGTHSGVNGWLCKILPGVQLGMIVKVN